jgi:hypothetical protein
MSAIAAKPTTVWRRETVSTCRVLVFRAGHLYPAIYQPLAADLRIQLIRVRPATCPTAGREPVSPNGEVLRTVAVKWSKGFAYA